MEDYIIQIFTATIGSLGFALKFNVKKERIIYIAIGCALTWSVYLISFSYEHDVFLSNAIAAASTTIYAEIFAKIHKAPATIFLLPSVVPLAPGGSLYYTMSGLVNNNSAMFRKYGNLTIKTACGIAIGIIIASVIIKEIKSYKRNK